MRAQWESQENLQTAQQYFFHVDWILQFQFLKLQVWKITMNIRGNCNSLPHMATSSNANYSRSTARVSTMTTTHHQTIINHTSLKLSILEETRKVMEFHLNSQLG